MKQNINKDDVLRLLPTECDNAIRLTDIAVTLNATAGSVRYYLMRLENDGEAEQLANRLWIRTKVPEPQNEPCGEPENEPEMDIIVEEQPFSVTSTEDGSVLVHDSCTLNLSQTYMEISKLYAHLAVLTNTEINNIGECAEVGMAIKWCGDEAECFEKEPSALDELVADMDTRLPEIAILRNVVYDPENYRAVLGRIWSSCIYVNNIVSLFEEKGFRKFTKGDVKFLFSVLYNTYIGTQDKERQTRLIRRQESAIRNMADTHMSYLRKTECVSLDDDGFYRFEVSPIDLFEINMNKDEECHTNVDEWI